MDDSADTAATTILTHFAEVVAAFETSWPSHAEYPFPANNLTMRTAARSARQWRFAHFRDRIIPLNSLSNYSGMKDFLEYMSQFEKTNLAALLKLAEVNISEHNLLLVTNPVTKVVGVLASLFALHQVVTLPPAVADALSPLVWGGVFAVLLYVTYVVVMTPVLARARTLRNLIEIALQHKEAKFVAAGPDTSVSAVSVVRPPELTTPEERS
jgi:hypothetical protein